MGRCNRSYGQFSVRLSIVSKSIFGDLLCLLKNSRRISISMYGISVDPLQSCSTEGTCSYKRPRSAQTTTRQPFLGSLLRKHAHTRRNGNMYNSRPDCTADRSTLQIQSDPLGHRMASASSTFRVRPKADIFCTFTL